MKKLILFALSMLLIQPVFARKLTGLSGEINSALNDMDISQNSVSISVKNIDNGKSVYKLNENILSHPASVQKILTLPAAIDALGEDYKYTTELYKRGNDSYVIKLGADPYFTFDNLESIISKINPNVVKQIYIDDSAIEAKDWGEGWQWDDNMNTLMPKFNSYNLDGNLISITIMPTQKGQKPLIINPGKFPIVFINNTVNSDKNDISVVRDNSISENALMLNGTVVSPVSVSFPISNMRRYFDFKLTQALENNKIYLKTPYIRTKVLPSDKKICQISHPVSYAIGDILKNSNNMVSEVTLKLAAGKAYSTTGTDILGTKLFDEYCKKYGLDPYRIRLVDASGVSKNNLVDAEFIVDYLIALKDNPTYKYMAKPGEGTLSTRLIPLADKLSAKTGTLADISSIAGYLTAKSGQKYAFCIIINDPKSANSNKKALEDYIIRAIYYNK